MAVLVYLTYCKYGSIGCICDFFNKVVLLKRKIYSQSPTEDDILENNLFLAKNSVLSKMVFNGKFITSEVII